jgi:hypothetical protein
MSVISNFPEVELMMHKQETTLSSSLKTAQIQSYISNIYCRNQNNKIIVILKTLSSTLSNTKILYSDNVLKFKQ